MEGLQRGKALMFVLGLLLLPWILVTNSNAQVNVTTWHNDSWRTGQNLSESQLKTTNVSKTQFGLLCKISLSLINTTTKQWSYQTYAQPLVVTNMANGIINSYTVYVVTQSDFVFAFTIPANADWSQASTCQNIISNVQYRDLLASTSPQEYPVDCCDIEGQDCGTISPTVGILGTPVIDNNKLYLITYSQSGQPRAYNPGPTCPKNKNLPTAWIHKLHALDLPSGNLFSEDSFGPAQIPSANIGHATFQSSQELQRPGLLLVPAITPENEQVDIGFGMMDATSPNPSGWIFSYLADDFRTMNGYPHAFTTAPGTPDNQGSGGGPWQGGGGLVLATDQNGSNYLYFSTADGIFDETSGSNPVCVDCADTFVKLTPDLQTVTDFFTPADSYYRWCNRHDIDYGSGGVAALPDNLLSQYPYLAIKGDKEGKIWAIDRTNPGKWTGGNGDAPGCGSNPTCAQCLNQDNNKETITVSGGYFHTAPALWAPGPTSTNYMYIAGADTNNIASPLTQYTLANTCTDNSSGPICQNSPVTNNQQFNFGTTPSVSANGSSNGIVWAINKPDKNTPYVTPPCTVNVNCGTLYAFDAASMRELYDSNCKDANNNYPDVPGAATKFSVPTIANGYVIIGTQSDIDIYGLLPSSRSCN